MGNCILTINGGSSSIKYAAFAADEPSRRIAGGSIEKIGPSAQAFAAAQDKLLDWIGENAGRGDPATLAAIGHRIVHGGPKYGKPQRITAEMIAELDCFSPYDPDHLPREIALIAALRKRFPGVPQVACFDTDFHHDMPRVAKLLPIPRRYQARGLRRYGFHGLSYGFLMAELAEKAGAEAAQGRVILAHLGSGASLAAVRAGRPVDTTMGFSPAGGLMMGTRSGDLDPGLIRFLADTENMTAERFHRMANHESGLLGVSGSGSDMRELLFSAVEDERAAEAVDLFCYQVKKGIGSFAAALGGVDTLVFSAGIGENCPSIRARICDGLAFLGIELDKERNARNAPLISTETAAAKVRVIRTDEELTIAKSVAGLLAAAAQEPE